MSKQLIGLRRGIRVLELLAAADTGMTFNDLKEAFAGLPASTVSRLLKVLVDERLVAYDAVERLYSLAERAGELADAVRGTVPVARRMQPVLERLANGTGCSAAFFEPRNHTVALTAKAEMPEAFHYGDVGIAPPHNRHGFRQLACAHMGAAARRALAHPYRAEVRPLAELKKMSVLVNTEDDQPGLIRICAPVFGADGTFAGVLGVSFFQRFTEKRVREMAEQVRSVAQTALT